MRLRDRCFECLLGFAVLLTLANLLLSTARYSIMVDTAGRPLGFKSRIECPYCDSGACFVTAYPKYRCRECNRGHSIELGDRDYPHLAGMTQ